MSSRQNQTTFGSSKEAHFRQRRPIFPRLSHFFSFRIFEIIFLCLTSNLSSIEKDRSQESSEHPSGTIPVKTNTSCTSLPIQIFSIAPCPYSHRNEWSQTLILWNSKNENFQKKGWGCLELKINSNIFSLSGSIVNAALNFWRNLKKDFKNFVLGHL